MPHPLPALAAVLAAPLFGLAVHASSMHAVPMHVAGSPAAARAANLPNNLCASCHGAGRAAALGGSALDARDLVAAHTYLEGAPRS